MKQRMWHLRGVRAIAVCGLLALHTTGLSAYGTSAHEASAALQSSLLRSLRGSAASGVVLRWSDGAVLARVGSNDPSTPGSVIKPLLLSWALQHGSVTRSTSVYCRRTLRVGQSRLPCTHPADTATFTARSALAASCNTYFAAVADRMRGFDFEAALRSTGLTHADATSETQEQRELTMLGVRYVTSTPLQLASAYRALMKNEANDSPVRLGLADSVSFGMANPARVNGLEVLGKTGTASAYDGGPTHGWFAGGLPGSLVLVVYVPLGNGGDAAMLAGNFFREVSTRQTR